MAIGIGIGSGAHTTAANGCAAQRTDSAEQSNEYVALNVCFSFELISVFWINSFITFLMWFGFILLVALFTYCGNVAPPFSTFDPIENRCFFYSLETPNDLWPRHNVIVCHPNWTNSLKWPQNTERNWIINEFAQKSIANNIFRSCCALALRRVYLHGVREFGGSVIRSFNLEVMNFCVFTLVGVAHVCGSLQAMKCKMIEEKNTDLRAIMGASNRNNLIRLHDCYIRSYFASFFLFIENVQRLVDFIAKAISRTELNWKCNVVTRFYYDVIFVSALANNNRIFNLIPINFFAHSFCAFFAV